MSLTADFELGALGSQIQTSDPGSLSAWNSVFSTHPTYDNTQVAHGTLAAKYAAAIGQPTWSLAGGPTTDHFGRIYLWLTPGYTNASSQDAVRVLGAGGSTIGVAIRTRGGVLRVADSNGTGVQGVVAIATGQWVRLEYHAIASASVGQIEGKLFNNADSITPSETIITTANLNTLAAWDSMRVGDLGGWAVNAWVDCVVGAATAYPGPFPVSTVAPVVTGSPAVGAVLSSDGGTWNGGATFTLAYQWMRDGAPIGGATVSTYTLQSADIGHTITCRTTATGVQATNETATATSNGITLASTDQLMPAMIGRFHL